MEKGKAAEMLLGSIPYGRAINTEVLVDVYTEALNRHPERTVELDEAFETLWEFKGTFPAKQEKQPTESKTSEKEFPKELVDGLAAMTDVRPKVCGTWIWLHGSTDQHATELKRLGCKFGKKKQLWYWSPPGSCKRRRKGGMSYDWIKAKHGERDLEVAA